MFGGRRDAEIPAWAMRTAAVWLETQHRPTGHCRLTPTDITADRQRPWLNQGVVRVQRRR
jgi:hypothetical protein